MATAKVTAKAKHKPVAKKKPTSKKESASKKLKPASITAQKAWQGFPAKLKRELRRALPDTDRDRVPDGFDCRPRDRKRQEAFLSVDANYLNSNANLALGEKLGEGDFGEVFSVRGNDSLVIKVPKYFNNPNAAARRWLESKQQSIERESKYYDKYDLNNEALFIPTKTIDVVYKSASYKGLVRPRVTTIVDNPSVANRMLTDDMLIALREKLVNLSNKGYAFVDGLQLGIDSAGRLLLFDVGGIEKHDPGSSFPFEVNNIKWLDFLRSIGKRLSDYERYGGRLNKGRKY